MAVKSGRNQRRRKIPVRVKRAATRAHRSRWVRLRGVVDGRLTGVPVEPAPAGRSAEHVTRLVACDGGLFHAMCSCGEKLTRKPTAQRYARGAQTRHLNQVPAGAAEVAA